MVTLHAIDRASTRVYHLFRKREDREEGLATWLLRLAHEAVTHARVRGASSEGGEMWMEYAGVRFVFAPSEHPANAGRISLLTVMPANWNRQSLGRPIY